MFGLTNLVPFLLASSPGTTPQITSFQSMAQQVNTVYRDLDQAPVYHQASSSVKFSFVSPVDSTTGYDDLMSHSEIDPEPNSLFRRVASKHGVDKPLAVYLPGLDGYGISATQQFEDLSDSFELWRMTVSKDDTDMSFHELVSTVANFCENLSLTHENRPITLIGESFGGLLAPAVALRIQNTKTKEQQQENPLLRGLVLVNPATSFDETQWSALGPFLASLRHLPKVGALPSAYSIIGGMSLSALIPDSKQFQSIASIIFGIPVQSFEDLTDLLTGMSQGFETLETQLPAETVQHRVAQWLPVGCATVNPRLSSLDVPTLVVAGQDDNFLPSQQEADRLVREMPSCKKLSVRGSGHFVLDDRVNLTEAILFSDIDPLNFKALEEKYDPIVDWKLPPKDVVHNVIENRVKPLRRLASPVFFSTDGEGKRWKGLSRVPSEGPLVFVANHQLLGLDLGMVIAELLEERGIMARGLAHPVIFEQTGASAARPKPENSIPGIQQSENNSPFDNALFQQFGAVKVSPRNYYRLLQTGQNVLLFPGGVREVFHGKDEAYQLFWPETADFVRTAARFNATVIPISAVGAADSLNVLVDAPELAKLPFYGDVVRERSANVTAARFNVNDEDELFAPPLVVPSLPARHYFMFGKPMSTADVHHKDMDECNNFYANVQDELNRGFDDILQARENDPFSGLFRRVAYEQLTGKRAPTFSMSEFTE